MKLKVNKVHKLQKKHVAIFSFFVIVLVGTVSLYLSKIAHAEIDVARFNGSQLPDGFNFTRGGNVFMEISQKGPSDTLDAKDGWAKIYLDPDRASRGVVGIFDGYYSGCSADLNGTTGGEFSVKGVCSPDKGEAKFDFYVGIERPALTGPNAVGIYKDKLDEVPCSDAFASISSKNMYQDGYKDNPANGTGWYQLALSDYSNKRCPVAPTTKTGKVVIFVKAYWVDSNNKEGRINAFKIGGAYNDNKKPTGALTGYWSKLSSAIRDNTLLDFGTASGEYAVQDRRTPKDPSTGWTQGDYTFSFGPDCDLPKNSKDPILRYIKWYDVDYSSTDPTKSFYNGKKPPSMKLIDKTAGNAVVIDAKTNQPISFTGDELGGADKAKSAAFYGLGDHIYEWQWFDVIASDGVVFWMPYDDYPSLSSGCGSYKQKISLSGTRGPGWTSNNFEASGGDTLTFRVNEQYDATTGSAPYTTSTANLSSPNSSNFDSTFLDPGAFNISDGGTRAGRAKVNWGLPGMGASSQYLSQRSLYFSYQIKNDAKNGAIQCFGATLQPESNTQTTVPLPSNSICVTINNSLKPYLSTTGADVHAGDCILETDKLKLTKIVGPPVNGLNLGSSGSYVVSSGGSIDGFGSGGSPGGTSLTFSKYGPMCRPILSDLQKDIDDAKSDKKNPAQTIPADGQEFNLSTLEPGKRYVVEFQGNGVVYGQSRAPVTIKAGGTLVVGKVNGGNTVGADRGYPASRANLPVVGMIANNIEVVPGVTTLNAALYAVGNINTCNVGDWKATGYRSCNNTLTVNGFAMAHDFSFRRVSNKISGLQVGEQIDYNAGFYLNPPPGFRVAGDAVKYLGEQAPLY